MGILADIFGGPVGGILDPVSKIIDNLHTSDAEKMDAKTKLLAVQVDISEKALSYEASLAGDQTQAILAEANGHSWMQRNWRPIIMLMFAYIVAHNFVIVPIAQMFGAHVVVLDLPPDLWSLLKIGIGGYVVGRSAEKIIPSTIAAMNQKTNV